MRFDSSRQSLFSPLLSSSFVAIETLAEQKKQWAQLGAAGMQTPTRLGANIEP